jgi:hypothetical protein
MGNRFIGTNKTGAELDTGRSHFEVGQHCFPAADSARDKNRNAVEMRQDFLRQHTGGHRPDVTAGLAAFDDDRVDPHAHELARETQSRCKAKDTCAAALDPAHGRTARQTARQHDMTDAVFGANIDQFEQLRMQRDEVHPERARGQGFRRNYLGREKVR